MAMTKKEQAYVEGLLTAGALRYTADVEPDVPVPEGGSGKTTRGFLFYGELFYPSGNLRKARRKGSGLRDPVPSSPSFHSSCWQDSIILPTILRPTIFRVL